MCFTLPQLKAVVVDEKLLVLHRAAVNFERTLPEYRCVCVAVLFLVKRDSQKTIFLSQDQWWGQEKWIKYYCSHSNVG